MSSSSPSTRRLAAAELPAASSSTVSASPAPSSLSSAALRTAFVACVMSVLVACTDAWQPDVVPKLYIKHDTKVPIFYGNVTDYFKLLAQDEHSLLIGARNHVYNVSIAQLRENRDQRIEWHSSDAHRELCTLKGKHDADCQNYIRVFARTDADRVMICGTNSYKPLCRYYTRRMVGDVVEVAAEAAASPTTPVDEADEEDAEARGSGDALTADDAVVAVAVEPTAAAPVEAAVLHEELEMSNEIEAQGRCPYSPQHNSTYVYTGGQLYSATVADFSGADPLIYRGTQRTEQYDLKQLNQPDFVSAVERNGYVLFFFREIAMEYMNCGKTVYSRVGRVCKNDRGGPVKYKADRWTSFLKTRLNCSVPGDYPFYFDEIQATSAIVEGMYETASSRRQAVIYAVFTTPPNAIPGSAICAFRTDDIMDAFEGRFKSQSDSTANWLPIAPELVPEPRPGRCVEDSRTLHTTTVNFVRTHTLMEQAVPAMHSRPLLTRVNLRHRFTAITVDAQIRGLDGNHYDVLFVGTDDGRVIKLVHIIGGNETAGEPIVITETQALPADQAVRELSVSRKTATLIVVGAGQVVAIPLHHCRRIAHCRDCVALQDPYCAWDIRNRECSVVDVSADSLKPINFLQRLQPVEVDLCKKHGEIGNWVDATPAATAASAAAAAAAANRQPTVLTTRGTLSAVGRSLSTGGVSAGNDMDNEIVVASIGGSELNNEINGGGDGSLLVLQHELGASSAEASGISSGGVDGDDVGRAGMSGSSIAVIASVLFVAGLTLGIVISRLRIKFGPCYNEHRNQINAYSTQKRHIQPLNSGKDINLLMEANAYSCHPKKENLEQEFAAKDRSHECKNSTENLEKEVNCKSTMGLTTVGATSGGGAGGGGHNMGTLQKCKKTYL